MRFSEPGIALWFATVGPVRRVTELGSL